MTDVIYLPSPKRLTVRELRKPRCLFFVPPAEAPGGISSLAATNGDFRLHMVGISGLSVLLDDRAFIVKLSNLEDPRIICLDWEGHWLEAMQDPNHPHHLTAWREGVRAMEICRRMHPDALLGWYMLPTRDVFAPFDDPTRLRELEALQPFLAMADVRFPSIYDFYADDQRNPELDTEWVRINVAQTVDIALTAPVIPVIWHRFHPSNDIRPRHCIPVDQFRAHLEAAVAHEEVTSVAWFNTDQWHFNIGTAPKEEAAEFADAKSFAAHAESIYYPIIREVLTA